MSIEYDLADGSDLTSIAIIRDAKVLCVVPDGYAARCFTVNGEPVIIATCADKPALTYENGEWRTIMISMDIK